MGSESRRQNAVCDSVGLPKPSAPQKHGVNRADTVNGDSQEEKIAVREPRHKSRLIPDCIAASRKTGILGDSDWYRMMVLKGL